MRDPALPSASLIPRANGRPVRRTVVYLPPSTAARLARRARSQGTHVSALVADAVRAMLGGAR